jgi:hypothetical protein
MAWRLINQPRWQFYFKSYSLFLVLLLHLPSLSLDFYSRTFFFILLLIIRFYPQHDTQYLYNIIIREMHGAVLYCCIRAFRPRVSWAYPAEEWDPILNRTWNISLLMKHFSLWIKNMDSMLKLPPSGLLYLYTSTKYNLLFHLRDSRRR